MFLMIHSVICDSYQFFKKQIINILILSIICSLIKIIIQYIIGPNIYELYVVYNTLFSKNYSLLKIVQTMTSEQKKIILHIFLTKTISLIINRTILYISIIYLIKLIISKKNKSLYYIIKKSICYTPTLLPLIFITFFITQIGFILLTFPGILLNVLLSLSPVLLLIEKKNTISAIKKSIIISWKYIYIVILPIIIWIFIKWLIITTIITLHIFPIYINIFLLNVLINIGYSFLIIYLFRFNTLLKMKNIV